MLFRIAGVEADHPDLLVLRGSILRQRSSRLRLAGELCAYTAPLLARYLQAFLRDKDVVLETSSVTFVDSTAIVTGVELELAWRERGRSLTIADPSEPVCRVVRILHLEERLFGAAPDTGALGPGIRSCDVPGTTPLEPVEARSRDRAAGVIARAATSCSTTPR